MSDLLTRGVDENGELIDLDPKNFKQVAIGYIPKEWNVLSFNNSIQPNAPICYGILQPGSYDDKGVEVVTISDMGMGYENLHKCSKEIEKNYVRSRIREGDLLLSVKGTTGGVDIVPLGFSGNISRDIARIRFKQGILPNFVKYVLTSIAYQQYLNNATVGTTRSEISIGILRNLLLPIPSFDEQHRIADILDAISTYITEEENYCQKLKYLKQGLMQDLLSGQVRVKV